MGHSPPMNLVALTGRFKSDGPTVEVRRRHPADPGVVVVQLVLPSNIARVAAEELRDGERVAVLGMLDIDVAPIVLVESIERLAE